MSGMVELEEIVEVHAAMVRRIATVYERHPDSVDDLVQDVWIAVWQAQPLSDSLPDPAPPPDEATAHAMRLTRLIEAVRSLPENLKVVASLYLEGMPIKDIALALGISEGNTSVRLHRAKSAISLSFGDPS